jgi:hypothetical protein
MDEIQTSAPTLTVNPPKWVGQLVAAIVLAEGIWGFLASVTINFLVPLLARAVNGDPGSPTYLGKGEINVPALFNSFLALCLAGIVFVLLYGWSRRKSLPVRAKMIRVPQNVSQPTAGTLSIITPSKAVAVPTQAMVNTPTASQISQTAGSSSSSAPRPQQSKPTPPPVADPAKAARPQPPKELYYNLVGEPINPTQDK